MTSLRQTRVRKKVNRIPSLKDVEEYARNFQGLDFTPQRFHDYHQRCHWRLNGYKIFDWKAVFRVWVGNSQLSAAAAPAQRPYRQPTQATVNAMGASIADTERQMAERDARLAQQKSEAITREEWERRKREERRVKSEE